MSDSINITPEWYENWIHITTKQVEADTYIVMQCEFCLTTFGEFRRGNLRTPGVYTTAVNHYVEKHSDKKERVFNSKWMAS